MRQAEALTRRLRPVPSLAAVVNALSAAGLAIRISALGGTVVLPLLGLASARGEAGAGVVALTVLAGLAFHVFAYVLNDVVDLELDRTEPRRARSPLVTGAITRRSALGLSILGLPLAAWLTSFAALASGGDADPLPALAALGAAAVGVGAYDLLGKRTSWPPLADVLQALGWASLVLAGAWLAGGPTSLTLAVAVYVAVFVTMANGVHGAIRDLPNDLRHGVRTTAVLLGARASTTDRREVPAPVMGYAWVLQVGLLAITCVAVAIAGGGAAAVVTAVLTLIAVLLLGAASRARSDADLLAAGMLHLLVALAIPIALVADHAPASLTAVLIVTYGLPLLAHGWLPGAARWAAARAGTFAVSIGDLVVLTRPHNCLAAGVAVVIGGHLGGADLAAEPVVRGALVAGLVAALVVAAANVSNDRADVAEDRINRPDRPIAAGRVSARAGLLLSLALATMAVVLAATLGAVQAIATGGLAVLSFAYSSFFKGTLLLGNVVVAALSASTIVFGALTLGSPTPAVAIGAAVVFLSVVASEILKCVADREGDRVAGRATVATRLPLAACLRLHAGLVVALMALVLAPSVVRAVPPAFAWASVAGVVIPQAIVLARASRARDPEAVRRVLPLGKVAWFTGLVSLAFLA